MGEEKRFGRYEVTGTIGKGAMGVVYLAEDPVIQREVAIKVVETHDGADEEELQQLQARFEREFQSAGRLSHPNIVGVHDVGHEDGKAFIAMEFVKGEGLDSILAQNRAFSFKEVADLTAQLASGLDYAHEFGIVHRDIKPANILVTKEGRPKITDFGVAKVATSTMTRTGTVVGTPAYMSPEQVTGHPVSGTADQFSLAVMIYQLLTGERPFTGENPTTIMYKIVHEEPVPPSVLNAMVPGPVDQALVRALSKNPDDRYPTCSDLAEAFRAALGAAPQSPQDATVVMNTAHAEATVVDQSLQQPKAQQPALDPSLEQPQKTPPPPVAKSGGSGMRVVGLAVLGVAAIAAAVYAWAYGLGGLNGTEVAEPDPTPPAEVAAPVEITRTLAIQAGVGWSVWVDGSDTGTTTPGAVDITGALGDPTTVELRYDGLDTVTQTFTLGEDPFDAWAPEAAAAAAADLVAAAVEPEPPSTDMRSLTITSNPVGAVVQLNGETLNERTPASVELDMLQGHTVVVQLEDYETASWNFDRDDLERGGQLDSGEIFFPLAPSTPPGFVSISDPGYSIRVTVTPLSGGSREQRFDAARNHELRLQPGRYEIRMDAPDVFWSDRQIVTVASGETRNISQVPRAVDVQIGANPGNCVVWIDGVEIGPPPFRRQIVVGQHRFKFDWSATGGGEREFTERINTNGQRIFGTPGGQQ